MGNGIQMRILATEVPPSAHPAGAASAVQRALPRDVPLPGGEDAVGGAGGAAAAEVPRAESGTKIVISLHVVAGGLSSCSDC